LTEWSTKGDSEAPAADGRRRRWPIVATVAVLFCLMAGAGALAGATVSYAEGLDGRLLPGTVVAGVDVGSMTQAEALDAVRAAVAEDLDREITVRWRKQRWTTTPRRLGARTDARAVIAEVAAAQQGQTWQQWAEMRWLGRRAEDTADITVARNEAGVKRLAAAVARQVDTAPRDADVAVVRGNLELTHAEKGRKVAKARLARRLSAAVDAGRRRVNAPVRVLQPEVRDSAFRQVLHLDQSRHRLTLYLDGRKHRTWIVATGTGDYPTPLGRYEVSLKRYLPTWVNPDPTGWGADMPASIPPGPGNPLGLRALNWSAPGAIRFHGTQAISSLGTSASHGCVRMANGDVIELYDLVDVGAVILSEV
jgi:hypothetical protein